MKKLLVLALVLSMATMASAALELRVDGAIVTEISAIGTYTVSITTDAEIAAAGGLEGYWTLETPIAAGAFDVSSATLIGTPGDCYIMQDPYPLVDGMTGANGGVFTFGTAYAAGSTLVDGMVLNVTNLTGSMTLIQILDDGETKGVTYGTVNFVPEPITMTLLGLGGLFLRRRGK